MTTARRFWRHDFTPVLLLAILALVLHLVTLQNYGLHRDEFLYIAMRGHLAWGYLEGPPFIAIIAKLSNMLFGHSVAAYRLFPALFSAGLVLLIGLITRELGGKRFAQGFAAAMFVFSPAFLRTGSLLMPNVFEHFWVGLAVYLVLKILNSENPRYWILLGLVAGLGLLTKYTVLLFIFSLGLAFFITHQRRQLAGKGPWLSLGLALLLFFPNLLWQHAHAWPVAEHLRTLAETQLANVQPGSFLTMQLLVLSWAAPFVVAGLLFLLLSPQMRTYRVFGWFYLITLAALLLLNGKFYYLLPVYPVLFAAGAVYVEQRLAAHSHFGWVKAVAVAVVILGNLPGIPYGLPILRPPAMRNYGLYMAEHFHLQEPLRWEDGKLHLLPQDYADMLGWENMVATVAEVYRDLRPEYRPKCAILAANYGEAGAIDFYRQKFGLPAPICAHGSYSLWGPGQATGELVIAVGVEERLLERYFERTEVMALATEDLARETVVPIYFCQNPKRPLTAIWPELAEHRY